MYTRVLYRYTKLEARDNKVQLCLVFNLRSRGPDQPFWVSDKHIMGFAEGSTMMEPRDVLTAAVQPSDLQ